ncbi:MAG TPA: GntR family transcriptional regulator [Tissierellaceae bacterium]
MKILISNSSKEPIYEQIYKQIKSQIIDKSIKPDEALPSIRALAKELKISVITTKRAYDELENSGFIYSVPGKGSYVKEQNEEYLRETKLRKIEENLQNAIKEARMINLEYEDLQKILYTLYEEV